jgi:hypothetical protein
LTRYRELTLCSAEHGGYVVWENSPTLGTSSNFLFAGDLYSCTTFISTRMEDRALLLTPVTYDIADDLPF